MAGRSYPGPVPPGLEPIDPSRRFGDVVALDGTTFAVAEVPIVVGWTALLIPVAGRVYAGAMLRTGAKVWLHDAWRVRA